MVQLTNEQRVWICLEFARSPDLAVYDFFLWGFLKQAIWTKPLAEQPKYLRELRAAIVSACDDLQRDMIIRAFTGMVDGVARCIEVDERAFSNE